jgi:hypothetical protein
LKLTNTTSDFGVGCAGEASAKIGEDFGKRCGQIKEDFY